LGTSVLNKENLRLSSSLLSQNSSEVPVLYKDEAKISLPGRQAVRAPYLSVLEVTFYGVAGSV
jgi:hypothetical protein